MAEQMTERRRRAQTPFLTLLVVIAVAAGLAIGLNSLRSATNGSAAVTAPPTVAAPPIVAGPVTDLSKVIEAAKRAGRPVPTPVAPSPEGPNAAPGATWLACRSMDATSYRQLCSQGDGGRWIVGS